MNKVVRLNAFVRRFVSFKIQIYILALFIFFFICKTSVDGLVAKTNKNILIEKKRTNVVNRYTGYAVWAVLGLQSF